MARSTTLALLSLATLVGTALGQTSYSVHPGTLNYIEGYASVDGNAITRSSVGKTGLRSGQTLATSQGRAEILLTPGVFLRLGENSTVRMVSPNLTHTEVALLRGRADVEVDQIYKQNLLLVDQGAAQTQLLQNGLYAFNADAGTVRVLKGKAKVFHTEGSVKGIEVKGGRELQLNTEMAKAEKFDKDEAKNEGLYRWSSLRSEYLGEANQRVAMSYSGGRVANPGWFWDSGLYGYTYLPGSGLYPSPFGYGFYSPSYLYGGGLPYGYGYGGGYYGGSGGVYRSGQNAGFVGGRGYHSPGGVTYPGAGGGHSAPAPTSTSRGGFTGGHGYTGGGGGGAHAGGAASAHR